MTVFDPQAGAEYYLKLTGKVNVPEALEVDDNYEISIAGSVTEERLKNADNGVKLITYIFEPVMVGVLTPKGEKLKARDPRKMSQKWRALVKWHWEQSNFPMDEEAYYQKVMNFILANGEEIIQRALSPE